MVTGAATNQQQPPEQNSTAQCIVNSVGPAAADLRYEVSDAAQDDGVAVPADPAQGSAVQGSTAAAQYRPRIVFTTDSGCSNISFCMKVE